MKMLATGYLSRRLVVFGAIICSTLVGLEAWHEWDQRAVEVRQMETAALNVARAVAREADGTFRIADNALFGITERLRAIGRSPEALNRLSQSMALGTRSLNSIGALFVYDAEGNWIASSLDQIPPGMNNADRVYFQYHKANPSLAPHLSEPIRSRSSGAWIILVSRRLQDPEGNFAGVVAATVDVEQFVRRLSGFDVGSKGAIALLSREGSILARLPFSEDLIGRDMSGTSLFQKDLPIRSTGVGRNVSPIDGNTRINGFATASMFPVVAYAAVSEDEALAAWRSSALMRVAVLGLLLAALAGLGLKLLRDVQRRERAEGELARSEGRYRMLAENTSDIIIRLNLDFKRTYVSPSCLKLFGYTPEEMLSLPPLDFVHPENLTSVRETLHQIAGGQILGGRAVTVYRLRHKSGPWIWVEATLDLAQDENGLPDSIVGVLRDVGARKMDEARLVRAREAAEAAQLKAEEADRAKSEFLAAMSHEIRTPLNGVIGYADLLLDETELGPVARKHADRIRTAGAALLTVVNDVLDFSKVEAGQIEIVPRPFAVEALIDNAVSIVRPSAERKGLALAITRGPDLPAWIAGDEDRLRQILLNLLNNAVKFTPIGRIRLTVLAGPSSQAGARSLRFEIRDTGIGIPADKCGRLFRRFSQVDGSVSREYGGTGLGLAISKSLVELMGGTIGVASVVGEGSTFWFEVALPETTPEVGAQAPATATTRATGKRLLLAEDVPLNQELVQAILGRAGHTVDVVGDGVAAVAAVQARPYDLVLMDVQMPVMDGITATRRIRALGGPLSRVPIVALTANVLPQQVAELRAAGLDDHVGKPFRTDALLAVIDHWTTSSAEQQLSTAEDVSAPATQINPNVLDRAVLAGMEASFGAERLGGMLDLLAGELDERFRSDASDREQIAYDAHAMVAAAGTLGFVGFASFCREIETAVKADADLTLLIQRLEEQRAMTQRMIQELRAA